MRAREKEGLLSLRIGVIVTIAVSVMAASSCGNTSEFSTAGPAQAPQQTTQRPSQTPAGTSAIKTGKNQRVGSLSPDGSTAIYVIAADQDHRVVLIEETRGTQLQLPVSPHATAWLVDHGADEVLWEPDGIAVALSVSDGVSSEVYACVRDVDGTWRALDLSDVENGNRGRLGRPKEDFRRMQHSLLRWTDGTAMYDGRRIPGRIIWIRTRFWDHTGQRYTASGPVAIELGGRVVWQ